MPLNSRSRTAALAAAHGRGTGRVGTVVLRRRGTVIFAVLVALVELAGAFWVLADPGVEASGAGRASYVAVFGPVLWVTWRFGLRPKIVVDRDRGRVVSPIKDTVIPIGAIAGAHAEAGLVIRLVDGRSVDVFAFSSSAVGRRSAAHAARAVQRAARGAQCVAAGDVRSRWNFGLVPLCGVAGAYVGLGFVVAGLG